MTAPERDLAAIVDELRRVGWKAIKRLLNTPHPYIDLLPSWRDPSAIEQAAEALRAVDHAYAPKAAARFEAIAAELRAGPRAPNEKELVERVVRDEIDVKTLMAILDLDFWEAVSLFSRHRKRPPRGIS